MIQFDTDCRVLKYSLKSYKAYIYMYLPIPYLIAEITIELF